MSESNNLLVIGSLVILSIALIAGVVVFIKKLLKAQKLNRGRKN